MFRDDTNIFARRADVGTKFQSANVIESLSDDLSADLRILERRIKFELEEDLFGVKVDKIFRRQFDSEELCEKIFKFLFGRGVR